MNALTIAALALILPLSASWPAAPALAPQSGPPQSGSPASKEGAPRPSTAVIDPDPAAGWRQLQRERTERMAADPFSPPMIQALAYGCVPHHLENCETTMGGYFNGPNGKRLYWQLQEGEYDDYAARAGFAFFTEASGVLTPVFWAHEAHDYDPPQLIWVGFPTPAPVIAIAGTMTGNGHYNADALFRWIDGPQPLVPIDNVSWWNDVRKRLPAGLSINKGVSFRYSPSGWISADASLWRAEDGDCCPGGGTARLFFEIENDVLVLKTIEIKPSEGDEAP